MNRSVSTDLELHAGTYSVLMKITARRFNNDPTPEDVIRDNVSNRQNKLIQVGLSYDLAHAKGEIRETEAERKERKAREEKKKAAEKNKQRELLRKKLRADFEYKKREKAREKRQTEKRQAYEAKKIAKAKAAEQSAGTPSLDGPSKDVSKESTAAGAVGGIEKQTAAGATEGKSGEPASNGETRQPLPTEPATRGDESKDTVSGKETDAAKDQQIQEAASINSAAAHTPESFEKALKSIPSVTVNGEPATASLAKGPQSAAPSTLAPNDDYQYDSDGSFNSSIDSVLDFPREPIDDDNSSLAEIDPPVVDGGAENQQFEDDPWNAICIVGLRVYSKNGDADCRIEVVKPKLEDDTLDLDDVSKGASGQVEGKGDGIGGVKAEAGKD